MIFDLPAPYLADDPFRAVREAWAGLDWQPGPLVEFDSFLFDVPGLKNCAVRAKRKEFSDRGGAPRGCSAGGGSRGGPHRAPEHP